MDLSRPNINKVRQTRDGLKSVLSLITMALSVCKHSHYITSDIDEKMNSCSRDLQRDLDESLRAINAKDEIAPEDLSRLILSVQDLLLYSSTLGSLVGVIKDLEELLSDTAGVMRSLTPGTDNPEEVQPNEVSWITYRMETGESWNTISMNEFLGLRRADRARILVQGERNFLDEGNHRIPDHYAFLDIAAYIACPSNDEPQSIRDRMSILLVDEDELLCKAIKHKLLAQHPDTINVVTAQTGLECTEIIEGKHKHKRVSKPCMFFLDLDLPANEGVNTLARIRTNNTHANAPVFVLTANESEENIDKLAELECDGLVLKKNIWDFFDNTISS